MAGVSKVGEVETAMREINRAWLEGRIEGREGFLAGLRDFFRNATMHDFREFDHQIDVAGNTAVSSFRYEMVYERAGKRYRAAGREWLAVWRTMLDLDEKPD